MRTAKPRGHRRTERWYALAMLGWLVALTLGVAFFVAGSELASWRRRRRTVERTRRAVSQIGNSHQLLEHGQALLDLNRLAEAASVLREAVAAEPDSLAARWTLAIAEFRRRRFEAARDELARVLAADQRYKFGDASLLYGKALAAAGDRDAAAAHLTKHIRLWYQPEALATLAQALHERGDQEAARRRFAEFETEVRNLPGLLTRIRWWWAARSLRRKIVR